MTTHLSKKETRIMAGKASVVSLNSKSTQPSKKELMKIAHEIKTKNKWIFEELKKY